MVLQGVSVIRNRLRPETVPLAILAIKRGLLCNFQKNFKGQSLTDLKFSITIEF